MNNITNKTHIVFLLPTLAGVPSGGVKVILEYANRLVKDSVNVSVVYPASVDYHSYSKIEKIKVILRYIYYKIFGGYSAENWFNLDPRVHNVLTWSLNYKFLPKGSHYIATGVKTSFQLNKLLGPVKKYYFIQGFENWIVPDDIVINSYRLDLKKIVVSNWLKDLINSIGFNAYLVPNGFNRNDFFCKNEIYTRDVYSISMMYHENPSKGFNDGYNALEIIKKKYPAIRVSLFGVFRKPKDLPMWIDYFENPSIDVLNDIYNSSSLFIAPSHNEGWGLTVGEAMMCGCAVVCTNTPGHMEMAIDNHNAIVVPQKSPELIAKAIIQLISNNELRIKIASTALQHIKLYDWESSYTKMKKLLEIE